MNACSKFQEIPTRMITAAMAIDSPNAVRPVRTGRFRMFLAIRVIKRTDQSSHDRFPPEPGGTGKSTQCRQEVAWTQPRVTKRVARSREAGVTERELGL